MTKKEIIQALECCSEENKCQQCPYYNKGNFKCLNYKFFKDLLDLINRQQAEIERLKGILNTDAVVVRCGRGNGKSHTIKTIIEARVNEIRAEAIKEFAERLKERAKANEWNGTICGNDIDNLVKEMIGE